MISPVTIGHNERFISFLKLVKTHLPTVNNGQLTAQ